MKKELKRLGTLMLAAAMSVSGLTACGGKGNETGAATEVTATGGAATQSTAAEAASYPLDTDVTVTYWSELNGNVAANFNNMGDTEFGKKLQEESGVKIEFQHPAVGQTAEAFNLLLGKTDLPDVSFRINQG